MLSKGRAALRSTVGASRKVSEAVQQEPGLVRGKLSTASTATTSGTGSVQLLLQASVCVLPVRQALVLRGDGLLGVGEPVPLRNRGGAEWASTQESLRFEAPQYRQPAEAFAE